MNIILSGDAGATKTELALFSNSNGKISKIYSKRFISKNYSGLDLIIKDFLNNVSTEISSACIGVPGPVINGKIISTNLPWILNEKELSGKLKIKNFKLINDLEALAYSIEKTNNKNLILIYAGNPSQKNCNKVVIAPGTGLGQAALIFAEGKYNIVATEGGHTEFAPVNAVEFGLSNFLKKKYGHVSWERIASGSGITDIFNYLKSTGKFKISTELISKLKIKDKASVISDETINSSKSKICIITMDIFASVLGRQAGNMVLNYNATGGVYLGGGIPAKNISLLKKQIFLKSFLSKGRLSYMVKMTPVYIINNDSAGLEGAAAFTFKAKD